MKLYSPLVAGAAYFVLGGLWFTPLFGKAWDRAVGFDRPPRWRPAAAYYLGPLVGCLVAAFAMYALLGLAAADTLGQALQVGAVAGLGFSACVTAVNAVSPNVPRPALYAVVVGSYHAVGALLCAAIIHGLGR
jgi:Protein of unknown function (DUF1761)